MVILEQFGRGRCYSRARSSGSSGFGDCKVTVEHFSAGESGCLVTCLALQTIEFDGRAGGLCFRPRSSPCTPWLPGVMQELSPVFGALEGIETLAVPSFVGVSTPMRRFRKLAHASDRISKEAMGS